MSFELKSHPLALLLFSAADLAALNVEHVKLQTEESASRRPVMAAISELSLVDVLHQAPTSLQFLQQGRCLRILLATNKGLRDVVQQYVTHVTIPDQSHMLTFAQDQWPNLQRLSLRSVQDPSAVAGLSQGDWQISRLEPTFAKLDLDAIMALRTGM